MGLDPEFDDYEEGDECPLCVDLLFDGKTPKYVEVDVSGVEVCPGAPPFDPNGTWLLTQAFPCQWWGDAPGWAFYWILNPGQSTFVMLSGPAFMFRSIIEDDCIDAFVNQLLICSIPAASAINGYALMWWGPTIGP